MIAPALDVRGARKAFGAVAAVDGVDLAVADHEVVALVGPSGCGKSTLLRLAAGLVFADSGEIRIGGDVVDDGVRRVEPEHRRAHVGARWSRWRLSRATGTRATAMIVKAGRAACS